jgi:DNA-binding winged helix-turn-helix (wHTH) protein
MTPGGTVTYQFGAFRLDPAERLLLRDGQAVSLTPKAFDLLVSSSSITVG